MASAELLTLQQQLVVLRGLLPIFDYSVHAAREMRRLGYRRFEPAHQEAFPEDYSDFDLRLSELVAVERSKELFAWPFRSWPVGGRKQLAGDLVYRSPSLEALRQAHGPVHQAGSQGTEAQALWETELDPIARTERQMRARDAARYVERERHLLSVASSRRQTEIKALCRRTPDQFTHAAQFEALVLELMHEACPPLGFKFDEERSRSAPSFSKPLTQSWDIVFVLMRLDWSGSGSMDLRCAVVPRGIAKRPRNVGNQDFLFIQFWRILPAFMLYEFFRSSVELEVCVYAFTSLYNIAGPPMEVLLKNLLPQGKM